jgi:glycosyltransferase involved in cell wall biosynthesis
MKKPALSVGLPVYNGERYLRNALDSLLNQDFEDFELIISDNGSSDQTEAICRDVARKDSRIRYSRSDVNRGATWNFRRVVELAEGDFFKYAAYDDECYPTMLSQCMEVMRTGDPTVGLVYTQSEFIDENSTPVFHQGSLNWDRVGTTAPTPHQRLAHVIWRALHGHAQYGVIRSSFLRRARPYGSIAADWALLAELAMMGKIVEIPEVLFRLRKHNAITWNADSTPLQILYWHDPEAKGIVTVLPFRIAVTWEYVKTVWHAPLTPWERVLCMPVACFAPTLRNLWIWFLNVSGPMRRYLREITGCKALLPGADKR